MVETEATVVVEVVEGMSTVVEMVATSPETGGLLGPAAQRMPSSLNGQYVILFSLCRK